MAATPEGAALTAAHRTAQVNVQALALSRFTRLWPLWTPGDESSFERLVSVAIPLVRVHYQLSSSMASTYYQAFRRAEGASGEATPRLAPALNVERVTSSLFVTGEVMTRKALASGVDLEEARRVALVRTSGAVGRHVATGGRATLIQSTAADPQAQGYQRITHAKACDFCRMLAGRGAVYSDDTADFRAHDHCSCTAEPRYVGRSARRRPPEPDPDTVPGVDFEGAWDDFPAARREVAAALRALQEDYDLPTKRVQLREAEEFGQMAGKSRESLYFSPRFADDDSFRAWQKEMDPYLVDTSRAGTVNHEVGHVLEQHMGTVDRDAWDDLHAFAREDVSYEVGGRTVTAPRWQAGDGKSQPSVYAQESPYEFLAECFADWRKNGEAAHPSSIEVGRRIDAVLKRRK